MSEEMCRYYNKDFGIECRIGRFHNIYGPFGTWKGKFIRTMIIISNNDIMILGLLFLVKRGEKTNHAKSH